MSLLGINLCIWREPVRYWKSLLSHRYLWITYRPKSNRKSLRAAFSAPDTSKGDPSTLTDAVRGDPYGWKGSLV